MYVKLTYIHVNVHGSQYCLSKYCSFCQALVQEVMSLFSSIYAKSRLQILKQGKSCVRTLKAKN